MLTLMLMQLGTDCKLQLMIGGENGEYYDTVWHSSACSDSSILWVSLQLMFSLCCFYYCSRKFLTWMSDFL